MRGTPWLLITHHPRGRRVYLLDRRIHHGRLGLWLIASALIAAPSRCSRWLLLSGLLSVLHDWPDAPWPTTDPPA